MPGANVVLDPALLDHVDAIVRLGVTINPAGNSNGERVPQPAARCR